MASSVCRVCLARNIKMLNIDNDHLLQVFEKLTDSKLNTESEAGIPSTVCYICHRQLQRCHMFSELARSSERTMRELLHNNIQITYNTITMLSPTVHTLSITSTQHVSIINHIAATSAVTGTTEKYIKLEEPLNESRVLDFSSATVKEEQVTINIEFEEAGLESLPTSWDTVEEEKKDMEIEESVCESVPTSWTIIEEEKDDIEIEKPVCESVPTNWTISEEEKKNLELDWATVEEEKKDLVIEDTELIYKESLVTSENAATIDPKQLNRENVTNIEHQPINSHLYCDICKRKFEFKYQMVKHLNYHKRKIQALPCTICGRVYSSLNYLTIHMRTHTGDKPFSCSKCDEKFIGKVYLYRHMKSHKEETSNCNVCDQTFTSKIKLVKHMSSHTAMRLYPCSQCEKTFNNHMHYTRHIRIHSLEKIVNTEQSQDNSMVMNTKQITNNMLFTCNKCDKSFTRNSSLRKHMQIHFGDKSFSCNECHKEFSNKFSLNQHMRLHTGEKPYSCHVCNDAFAVKPKLIIHMRLHTGEEPYACTHCDKVFMYKSSLTQHTRAHTRGKSYPCTVCDKMFTRNHALVKHMRIHTGQKPYSCTACEKSFRNRSNLTAHMLSCHTGKKD